jgi:hypothetical protein
MKTRSCNIARLRQRPQANFRLSCRPLFPYSFVYANDKLVCVSHQWNPEQHGFLRKFFQPSLVRKLRIPQTELGEALRGRVDQSLDAEFLREPTQLARRGRSLHQVYEMCFDSSFRKEAKRLPCVGILSDTENLNFQVFSQWLQSRGNRATVSCA